MIYFFIADTLSDRKVIRKGETEKRIPPRATTGVSDIFNGSRIPRVKQSEPIKTKE